MLQDPGSKEASIGWENGSGQAQDPRFGGLSLCHFTPGCGSSSDLWLPPSCPAPVVRRPFSLGGRRSDSGCVRWAGRRGRVGGRAAGAACHKGKGCLAAPAPRAGDRQGRGVHRWEPAWWGAGMCSSGWAASLLAVGAERRGLGEGCVKSLSELLSNNFPVEEESSGLLACICRIPSTAEEAE